MAKQARFRNAKAETIRSDQFRKPRRHSRLKILLTNAFGLTSKFGDLVHVSNEEKPDVIVVTETKFSQINSQSEVQIDGYSDAMRVDRTSRGGGVAVWVKSELAVVRLENVETHGFEVLWFTLRRKNGSSIVFGAFCRPGSCRPDDVSFLEYIDDKMEEVRSKGSGIVLLGDLNVHSEQWLGSTKTTRAGEFAEEWFASHGLIQHVDKPTRGEGILDVCLSDLGEDVSTKLLEPLGKSDHAVVILDIGVPLHKEKKVRRKIWRYHKSDWNRMKAHLASFNWESIFAYNDVDVAAEKFTSVVSDAMSQFIPSRVQVIRTNDPSWWTPECSDAVDKKRKAYCSWRNCKQEEEKDGLKGLYREECLKTVSRLRDAKNAELQTVKDRVEAGSLRDKEWWSVVKKAAGEGRSKEIPVLVDENDFHLVSASEKAEEFNKFYASKLSKGVPL